MVDDHDRNPHLVVGSDLPWTGEVHPTTWHAQRQISAELGIGAPEASMRCRAPPLGSTAKPTALDARRRSPTAVRPGTLNDMRVRAALLIATVLLAGCGTSALPGSPADAATDGPAAAERPSPPADCVNPPPDITTVIEQDERVACYGDDELELEAHAVMLRGAVDCPGQLEPAWLHCATLELYELPGTGRAPEFLLAARVPNRGPSLIAVLHPAYEVDLSRGLDALVTATGHFDDAEARSCRLVSWPDGGPPSPDEVVAGCRSTFVVTHLEPLEPPSQGAAETPAPSTSAFAIDDIAQVITTNLVVRTAPGIDPSSEIHPTVLDAPALVYVIGGPVSADDYEWYEVIPANLDYLPTVYPASGWVAAGSREGEPWIGGVDLACPDPSSLLDVVSLSELGTIACFGSETLTLEGTFAGCRDTASEGIIFAQGWPFGTLCTVTPDGLEPAVLPNPGDLIVHSDGGAALSDADIGSRLRVTGHFDDAAARSCSFAGDAPVPPRFPVVFCRAQFVGTDLAVIEEPSS